MNKALRFLKVYIDLNKNDLILLCLINISASMILNYVDAGKLITLLVVAILLTKNLHFAFYSSIMPTLASGQDRFSWKYFQSLPINRKGLLFALAGTRLISLIPFLTFVVAFFPAPEVVKAFEMFSFLKIDTPYRLTSIAIPLFFLFGIFVIRAVVRFSRVYFQKKKTKLFVCLKIRNFVLGIVILIYGIMLTVYVDARYGLDLKNKIASFFEYVEFFFSSWHFTVALIGFTILMFYRTLKTIVDEKMSYTKIEWNSKKDIPLTLIIFSILLMPTSQKSFLKLSIALDKGFGTLSETGIVEIIRVGEPSELVQYVRANGKETLTKKNNVGYTPLLVAVAAGNLEMYGLLKSLGAKYDGDVISEKAKVNGGMDISFLAVKTGKIALIKRVFKDKFGDFQAINKVTGNTLLHKAANYCDPVLFDFLIENGVDVNVQNKKGETAAHIVARTDNCFGAGVALREAGADFTIKTKKGDSVLSYNKKTRGDYYYYIKKYSRAPASKKL